MAGCVWVVNSLNLLTYNVLSHPNRLSFLLSFPFTQYKLLSMQVDGQAFDLRTILNGIGDIGRKFATCRFTTVWTPHRFHLVLSGDIPTKACFFQNLDAHPRLGFCHLAILQPHVKMFGIPNLLFTVEVFSGQFRVGTFTGRQYFG